MFVYFFLPFVAAMRSCLFSFCLLFLFSRFIFRIVKDLVFANDTGVRLCANIIWVSPVVINS
jgi:hypothetical protein